MLVLTQSRKRIMNRFKRMNENQRSLVISRVPNLRTALEEADRRNRLCPGRPDDPCVFGGQATGKAVRLKGTNAARCVFCGPVGDLDTRMATPVGFNSVVAAMRRMGQRARKKLVDERLPEKYKDAARLLCGGQQVTRKCQRADADRLATATAAWSEALRARGTAAATPTADESKVYREKVLDDRARVRRRFGFPAKRVRPMAAIENDSGLPPAKRTRLAADFQMWAEYNSWALCCQCGTLLPRSVSPESLRLVSPACVPETKCYNCKAIRQYVSPRPSDVPWQLQGLDEEAAYALSPLEVDTGPYVRAKDGYRQHSAMMRFRWKAASVENNVGAIKDPCMRRRTFVAMRYLRGSNSGSAWRSFHSEHEDFLHERGLCADERVRTRFSRFIERPGVECALWPTIFFDVSLCLTQERATNPGRKAVGLQSYEAFVAGRDDVFDEADFAVPRADKLESPEVSDGRHSVKRFYQALALAADLSFGRAYDVLHFAYDLTLWTSLGAKRNLQCGVPLQLMLSGESFSPLYWRRAHLSLLDIVRQRGFPQIFLTIAPYEWSFPYHVALRDAMTKTQAGRQEYALLETLHMTHVMTEAVWGLLCGRHKQKLIKDCENDYQIIPAVNEDGTAVDVFPVLRHEFQDGTHKDPTQEYHGSGRPHTHALLWSARPEQLQMHKWASASLPSESDATMRNFVHGAQKDKRRKTKWPAFEGESCWDQKEATYRLKHSAVDKAAGIRAYVDVIMEALGGSHQETGFQCFPLNTPGVGTILLGRERRPPTRHGASNKIVPGS